MATTTETEFGTATGSTIKQRAARAVCMIVATQGVDPKDQSECNTSKGGGWTAMYDIATDSDESDHRAAAQKALQRLSTTDDEKPTSMIVHIVDARRKSASCTEFD